MKYRIVQRADRNFYIETSYVWGIWWRDLKLTSHAYDCYTIDEACYETEGDARHALYEKLHYRIVQVSDIFFRGQRRGLFRWIDVTQREFTWSQVQDAIDKHRHSTVKGVSVLRLNKERFPRVVKDPA